MRFSLACAALSAVVMSASVARSEETAVAMEPEVVTLAPMTFQDACCALKNLQPGEHRICVIHPYTCCPVEVCFCLPCGCYCLECKEGCFNSRLVFKYKGLGNDVVIKFKKNGDVAVTD